MLWGIPGIATDIQETAPECSEEGLVAGRRWQLGLIVTQTVTVRVLPMLPALAPHEMSMTVPKENSHQPHPVREGAARAPAPHTGDT